MKPDGRVERTDQGGDTVGEGQAYGMLAAAAIGDQERFDLMWEWTKENLRQPNGLIAFLWRDGKVVDPKPASDADVDAARALLAASCRFDRPELEDEALALGRAILRSRDHPSSRATRCSWRVRGRASIRSSSTRATSRPPRSRR